MKVAKLILVSSDANSNKFYTMKQLSSDKWEANWGRVGTPGRTMQYNMYDWESKYREKVRGGYIDQTHLFHKKDTPSKTVTTATGNALPKDVAKLVDTLLGYARDTVSKNYEVSSDSVTQAMVDEAQDIIDNLVALGTKTIDVKECNNLLLKLYRTLPRKMHKVQAFLLTSGNKTEFNKRVSEEQNLLDVMAGQIKTAPVSTAKKDDDVLAKAGLEIVPATDADIKVIKSMMQGSTSKLKRAFQVTHAATRKNLTGKKTELQWHGSRNENWWNILKTGLKIRPANAIHTGSMYGNGIYHSMTYRKSEGYTSLDNSYWAGGRSNQAFLAVDELFTGRKLIVKDRTHEHGSMTWEKLRKLGDYHSLHAPAGSSVRNDETIVYKEDQVSIKYLIEVGG